MEAPRSCCGQFAGPPRCELKQHQERTGQIDVFVKGTGRQPRSEPTERRRSTADVSILRRADLRSGSAPGAPLELLRKQRQAAPMLLVQGQELIENVGFKYNVSQGSRFPLSLIVVSQNQNGISIQKLKPTYCN